MFAGRRRGEKLAPLVAEIENAGGRIAGRTLDARQEDQIAAFLGDADAAAPLEICIFNIAANVTLPLLETTERVFRKVWELACYAGFLTAREAARLMLTHGHGNIFFAGATASRRGGIGYAAFAAAKFGLRAVAESAARELAAIRFWWRANGQSRHPKPCLAGCRNGGHRISHLVERCLGE